MRSLRKKEVEKLISNAREENQNKEYQNKVWENRDRNNQSTVNEKLQRGKTKEERQI